MTDLSAIIATRVKAEIFRLLFGIVRLLPDDQK